MLKKASMETHKVLLYVLAAFLIMLIIVFGLKALLTIKQENVELDLTLMKEDLLGLTDRTKTDYGTRKDITFKVPDDANKVCFVDLTRRNAVLLSPLISGFPIIKSSLEADVQKNVFLYQNNELMSTLYVGEYCYGEYPFFACYWADANNRISLRVQGRGDCSEILSVFSACERAKLDNLQVLNKPFSVSTDLASLAIEEGAIINFPDNDRESDICIKPIPFEVEEQVSEVYLVTPSLTSLTEDMAELSIAFMVELLPEGISRDKVVIKHFDGEVWMPLETEVNTASRTARAKISEFGKYAVFGPGKPNAKITSPGKNDIFYLGEAVSFDGSESFDVDDADLDYVWDLGDGATKMFEERFSFIYDNPGVYTITLNVTDDDGNSDTDQVTIFYNTKNVKDPAYYTTNPLFMIYKEEGTGPILQLIPLSSWNDFKGGLEQYPYYAFYGYSNDPDDWKLDQLKQKHNSEEIRLFYNILPLEEGGLYSHIKPFINETPLDVGIYLDHWLSYEDVVIVDIDTPFSSAEQLFLLSSLYASFLNAPLFFIDSSNIEPYKAMITNAPHIYMIEPMNDPLLNFITSNAQDITKMGFVDLTNPTKNPYVELSSKVFPSFFVVEDIFIEQMEGQIFFCSFDSNLNCRDANNDPLSLFSQGAISYAGAHVGKGALIEDNSLVFYTGLSQPERLNPVQGSLSLWTRLNSFDGKHLILTDGQTFQLYVEDSILILKAGDNEVSVDVSGWANDLHHVVARWQSNEKIQLVVGGLVYEQADNRVQFTIGNSIYIGNANTMEKENPLDGVIDELRFFDHYIGTEEIQKLVG